jgi:tRNA-dihydrouridine synthase B
MLSFLNDSFNIGSLKLSNRLIQGPLAGFSCAPFRELYYDFVPPAYCVSEMVSAHDVLFKHQAHSRYVYRSPKETRLCYQLAGTEPSIVAKAALRLEKMGADLIDLNCGCPKAKIRKKGAGSALLDKPQQLCDIVRAVRQAIDIPLTVKIRIQGEAQDLALAKAVEEAGADAMIVHGRRWIDDYDVACDFARIKEIKKAVRIPVIANGDVSDFSSLVSAIKATECDAYMISRAGSGAPWLYQQMLREDAVSVTSELRAHYFMNHLENLARLEDEYRAVLQSKMLVRYYFKQLTPEGLKAFYLLNDLRAITNWLLMLGRNDPTYI